MSHDEDYGDDDNAVLSCYCSGECPDEVDSGACTTEPGGKCFAAISMELDENGEEVSDLRFGCMPPHEMALFQCRAESPYLKLDTTVKCCDKFDFCNKHLFSATTYILSSLQINSHVLPYVFVFVTFLFLILAFCVKLLIKRKRNLAHAQETGMDAPTIAQPGTTINVASFNNIVNLSVNREEIGIEMSSICQMSSNISISGMVQSKMAKETELVELIGKGSYGDVWKGKWLGETVAVKFFHSAQEEYWLRESKIYQTVLMRHVNILQFIAADIKVGGESIERLLVTSYIENGDLFHYLQKHPITIDKLIKVVNGIASALLHLHCEVEGIRGKPSIAHGNISSKCIFIKNSFECCVGDFGAAILFTSHQNKLDIPTSFPIKSRYTAPEILYKDYEVNNIEAYKMADVYSFGLLLWEMVNRCQFSENVNEYKLPYDDEICDEDELVHVVCEEQIRPRVCEVWESHDVLSLLCRVMKETWSANKNVRLTSLRIKKTLSKLQLQTQQST